MIKEAILIPYLRLCYSLALYKIRKRAKKYPIDVYFFVSEIAKWKAQSLYDLLASDNRFVPTICVYPMLKDLDLPSAQIAGLLEEKLSFFRNKNMRVANLWNCEERCIHKTYFNSSGIIFYQQTWDTPPAPSPIHVARNYLTFYIPYYLVNNFSKQLELCMSLQRHVFGYIVPSEVFRDFYYKEICKYKFAGKILGLGHTSTDGFHTVKRTNKDFMVIYAPHFSFPCDSIKRNLYYSTFLDNGELILEFAKRHKGIKWGFKPHPRLRSELEVTGVWAKEKIDRYYEEWEAIGESCYTSDYQELFVNSDLMITDCGSFLTEYACTGNPILRMVSPLISLSPNPVIEELYSSYYCTHNNAELEEALYTLIVQKKDPKKQLRQSAIDKVGLGNRSAAETIAKYISDLLQI